MDSRGAVADEDFTNDVNYAVGDTSRQQRGNDGAKFTSRIHNVVGEFNVVMVVIPNDFEVPVRKYKELIDGLDKRMHKITYIHIYIYIFIYIYCCV